MKIAYIGQTSGTCLHRARALERLGHQVTIIDPWSWLGRSKWVSRWLFHAGGFGVGLFIDQHLHREAKRSLPDLLWIDQGEFIGPNCLRMLRTLSVPIVNYMCDDPFGGFHNRRRFAQFRKAVPLYDLLVVKREANIGEAKRAGARHVLQRWQSADEVAHRPRALTPEEQRIFTSQVAFIGTWKPERGPFIADLIRRGVPLSIWGDRWEKAPEWPAIRSHWRGPGLNDDESYAAAILAAKICLGLLNKKNRDFHTLRSLEIPALGGLFCGERTTEHLALYDEGAEAVFWSDASECTELCEQLLKDEERRKEIARRGHERALLNNLFNEPVLASIIETVALQKRKEKG